MERIQQVRKYRSLTQDEVAEWFGLSGASWGRKERGKEKGLEPDMLLIFIEKTQIDPRFIFGQIDSLDAADMRKPSPPDQAAAILQLARAVEEKIPSAAKNDPDYDAFAKQEIRQIVRLLKPLEANALYRVLGFVQAVAGSDKKEKAAG